MTRSSSCIENHGVDELLPHTSTMVASAFPWREQMGSPSVFVPSRHDRDVEREGDRCCALWSKVR